MDDDNELDLADHEHRTAKRNGIPTPDIRYQPIDELSMSYHQTDNKNGAAYTDGAVEDQRTVRESVREKTIKKNRKWSCRPTDPF